MQSAPSSSSAVQDQQQNNNNNNNNNTNTRFLEVIDVLSSSRDARNKGTCSALVALGQYLEQDPTLAAAVHRRVNVLNALGNMLIGVAPSSMPSPASSRPNSAAASRPQSASFYNSRSVGGDDAPEGLAVVLSALVPLLSYPVRCRKFVTAFGKSEKVRALVACLRARAESEDVVKSVLRCLTRLVWHDEGAGVVAGVLLTPPVQPEFLRATTMLLHVPEATEAFAYVVLNAAGSVRCDLVTAGFLTTMLSNISGAPSSALEAVIALTRGNDRAVMLCQSSRELQATVARHPTCPYTQLLLCILGDGVVISNVAADPSLVQTYTALVTAAETVRKSMYDTDATVRALDRVETVVQATDVSPKFISTIVSCLPEVMSTLLVCLNNVDENICGSACRVIGGLVDLSEEVANLVVDCGAVETVCGIILDEDTRLQVHGITLLASMVEGAPRCVSFAQRAISAVVRSISVYCSGSVVSTWRDLHIRALVSALRVLRVTSTAGEEGKCDIFFQILHKAIAQGTTDVVIMAVQCLRGRSEQITLTNVQYCIHMLSSTIKDPMLARCLLALTGFAVQADHDQKFSTLVQSRECVVALNTWMPLQECRDVCTHVVAMILKNYAPSAAMQLLYFEVLQEHLLSVCDANGLYALSTIVSSNTDLQLRVANTHAHVLEAALAVLEVRPPLHVEEIGCALALLCALAPTLVELLSENTALRIACALVDIIAYYEYECTTPEEAGDVPLRCFQVFIELRVVCCPLLVRMVAHHLKGLALHDLPFPQSSLLPGSPTAVEVDPDPDAVHDRLVQLLPLVNGLACKDANCRSILVGCGTAVVMLELLSRQPVYDDLSVTAVYVLHNLGVVFDSEHTARATDCLDILERERTYAASLGTEDGTRLVLAFSDAIATLTGLITKSMDKKVVE
eukprot:PhM_4_TR10384/c0_g1_i1/m.31103